MDSKRFVRVRDLFQRAKPLGSDARQSLLDQECKGDAELRDEVESLLRNSNDDAPESDLFADKELDRLRHAVDAAIDAGAYPTNAPARNKTAVDAPDTISRYRIIRRVASGGMGTVYEAEQDSPRRRVALKMVHSQRATPAIVDRLQRESEILGRLQHPGIAQVYDAGMVDIGDGAQPYFAMEFVNGVSLTKFADSHKLNDRARLELLATICDAVHYAHTKGVIHRDLKPDNILVDADGRPKILDFGVARVTSDSTFDVSTMTRDGQILGTLSYMAPEQMNHGPDGITHTADVYALGIIGFELLTERLPHDVTGMSIAAALRELMDHDPPKMQTIDARFRGDVQTIIGTALQREPQRRYESAAALAADLRRYLAHQPIHARPPSAIYKTRKFVRRNRALVGGTLATILVLVAGIIVASYLAAAEKEQRIFAGEQETLAKTRAAEARLNNFKAMRGLLAGTQMFLDRGELWSAHNQLSSIGVADRGWAWNHVALQAPWIIEESYVDRSSREGSLLTYGFVNDYALLQVRESPFYVGVYDLRTGTSRAIDPHIDGQSLPFTFLGWRASWPDAPENCVALKSTDERLAVLDTQTGDVEIVQDFDSGAYGEYSRIALNHDCSMMSFWGYNKPRFSIKKGREEVFHLDSGFRPSGMQWTQSRFLRTRPYVLAARWGGTLFIVNTETGETASAGFSSPTNDLSFGVSPDESLVYARSANGVAVLRIPTLERVDTIAEEFGPSELVDVSRDGRRISAVYRGDATLRAFDIETGELLHESPGGQTMMTNRPHLSPDGRLICAESPNHVRPRIVDLDEPNTPDRQPHLTTLREHTHEIAQLAVSPDGSLLASAAPTGDIIVWDLQNNRSIARLQRSIESADHNKDTPLLFSADGGSLYFAESVPENENAAQTHGLTQIDLDTGERTWVAYADRDQILDAAAALIPEGESASLYTYAVRLSDGRIVQSSALEPRWGVAIARRPGEVAADVDPLPNFSESIIHAGIAADPNGRTFAVGEYLQLTIRDTESLETLHVIRDGFHGYSNVWGAAYTHAGDRFALATGAGEIHVYDTEFFERLCTISLDRLDGEPQRVYSMTWTPDDTRLVTSTGKAIRILESQRPFQRDYRRSVWNDKLDAARAALDPGAASDELQRTDPAARRIVRIEQWAESAKEEEPATEP